MDLLKDDKFYVWPSFMRSFELIDPKNLAHDVVLGYIRSRSDVFIMIPGTPFAQISIIVLDDLVYKQTLEQALHFSTLLPNYKKDIAAAPVSSMGCTPRLYLSRSTWAAVGVVLISSPATKSDEALRRCIFLALDYINGMPIPDNGFYSESIPSDDDRHELLNYIYKCSKENSGLTSEKSRDGFSPNPSIECVLDLIK